MQTTNYSKRYGAFFMALFVLATSSFALDQSFQIVSGKHRTREEGEVTRYFLITETTRFFFQPPFNWKLGADAAKQTVTFLAPNQGVAVKMQLGANVSCENPTQLRNEILSRYPNGEITAESVCYTSGGVAAPLFDIQWSNALKLRVTTRLIFVPTPNGTTEFSLSTDRDRFDANCWAINSLAVSFRSEPRPVKPSDSIATAFVPKLEIP